MAKERRTAGIQIPIDNSVLAKVKRDPIVIKLELTLQAVGCDGALHLRAHVSKPRVKRLKVVEARPPCPKSE